MPADCLRYSVGMTMAFHIQKNFYCNKPAAMNLRMSCTINVLESLHTEILTFLMLSSTNYDHSTHHYYYTAIYIFN